jgi:hypothetical protein
MDAAEKVKSMTWLAEKEPDEGGRQCRKNSHGSPLGGRGAEAVFKEAGIVRSEVMVHPEIGAMSV